MALVWLYYGFIAKPKAGSDNIPGVNSGLLRGIYLKTCKLHLYQNSCY